MADVNPPTRTAHVVLGLLSHGMELSGYDLRTWSARGLGSLYTTPAQSQIYKELTRLEAGGLVASRPVAQDDNPDKVVYRLTPAGHQALNHWIETSPVTPPVIKHPVAVQTSFAASADPAVVLGRLDAYIAATVDALADIEDLLVGIGDAPAGDPATERHLLSDAVLRWAMAIRTGDLEGAAAVRAILAERIEDGCH